MNRGEDAKSISWLLGLVFGLVDLHLSGAHAAELAHHFVRPETFQLVCHQLLPVQPTLVVLFQV